MHDSTVRPPVIRISISNDRLAAFLYLEPSSHGDPPLLSEIMKRIENARISYGTDYDKISEMIEEGIYTKKIQIASGKKPKPGQDGKIEFFVKTNTKLRPKELEDGRVDHKDLGYFINIEKGEKLARRIPPMEGAPGWTVNGQKILPPAIKDVRLPAGANTQTSTDDINLLIASANGVVSLGGDTIDVLQEKTVKSDIDYSTGNLEFFGALKITGAVRSGFKVKARGNIEIGGIVEDAEIESEENVVIHGGLAGNGRGIVKARNDVHVKHIINQKVIAGNNLYVGNEAINANIQVGNKAFVQGDGLMVGGRTFAPNGLALRTLGGVHDTATEIHIGANRKLMEELSGLKLKAMNCIEAIEKIKAKIFESVKMHIDSQRAETPEFLEEIEGLKTQQRTLKAELEEYKKREGEIAAATEKYKDAKIEVRDKIFRGVRIHYGDLVKSIKENRKGGVILPRGKEIAIT